MNENTAKSLVTSLINAAYEAGMHYESTMKESWQKKAEKVGDEIVRHLSNQASGQDNAEPAHGYGGVLPGWGGK